MGVEDEKVALAETPPVTKMRWDKADRFEPDPGAIIMPREKTLPDLWKTVPRVARPLSPEQKAAKAERVERAKQDYIRRKAQLARDAKRLKDREEAEKAKARDRSERGRLNAVIIKFGEKEALRLGVPQAFIDQNKAQIEQRKLRKAKEAARREKIKAKKLEQEQARKLRRAERKRAHKPLNM